jgi:asparagine synthetase B (glutamine-hydrolysing)
LLRYERGRSQLERAWRLDQILQTGRYDRERLQLLVASFENAVRRAIQPGEQATIALTGGQDARTVLAASAHLGLPVLSLTTGIPEERDVYLAKRLARVAGIEHRSFPINMEKASEWLPRATELRGGIANTLDYETVQYLELAEPLTSILLGSGSGPSRSYWIGPQEPQDAGLERMVSILLKRSVPNSALADYSRIWRPEYQELAREAPRANLLNYLRGYNYHATYRDAINYFYLEEYLRKFQNKDTMIARHTSHVVLPFLDQEWVEAIMAVPLSDRLANYIQVDMMRVMHPSLLRIPHNASMMRLPAAGWRLRWGKRLYAARRTVGRRLGSGRSKTAREFQWHREVEASVEPLVRELLAASDAACHEYFEPQALRDHVERQLAGARGIDHFLGALTVFELLARRYFSGQPVTGSLPKPVESTPSLRIG